MMMNEYEKLFQEFAQSFRSFELFFLIGSFDVLSQNFIYFYLFSFVSRNNVVSLYENIYQWKYDF